MEPLASPEAYQEALKRLDEIFFAEENTPEGNQAEAIVHQIEAYENLHFPIAPPDSNPSRKTKKASSDPQEI